MTLLLPGIVPSDPKPAPSLEDIRALLPASYLRIYSRSGNISGYAHQEADPFASWREIVQAGKSYFYGENYPLASFLTRNRSLLSTWQQIAFLWAHAHAGEILQIESRKKIWQIGLRGEYVQFDLPYPNYGGERSWASVDGKSRLLINLD